LIVAGDGFSSFCSQYQCFDSERFLALITLTRLNGRPFVVNAELIRTIEERPDTTIVLVNGDTFIVKEKMQEVVARAVEYARAVRILQT
jgi:flagellar protein FlbD